MEYHISKDGQPTKISDLETIHLKNIIKWIERRASEGIELIRGETDGIRSAAWADIEYLKGTAALEYMDYFSYIDELKIREMTTLRKD